MIFEDLREAPHGASIDADVAIVGAGAAGIALARSLAGTPLSLVLLESGGLEYEREVQDLYQGESVGLPYDVASSRQRSFGGTTNLWTGWTKPLAPIDFERRSWMRRSGWPISHGEVAAYYPDAAEFCNAPPHDFDLEDWAISGERPPAFNAEKLRWTFWRRARTTRFGEMYGPALRAQDNLRVVLHANVKAARLNEAGTAVDRLDLATLTGKSATARARRYVFACGGLENARLLLLSDDVVQGGVGNQGGMVGRCFMEHPHWNTARIVAPDLLAVTDVVHRRRVDGRLTRIGWEPSLKLQEKKRIANCSIELMAFPDNTGAPAKLVNLAKNVRRGRWPDGLVGDLAAIVGDLDVVGRTMWRHATGDHFINRPLESLEVLVIADPEPNPASRVSLIAETDELGSRRLELDWRMTELDSRTVLEATKAVAEEFSRTGLARAQVYRWLLDAEGAWADEQPYELATADDNGPYLGVSWHHIGTTRMSKGHEDGVVDGDCRVHGCENLFVAGSSVFATAGNANPTLTIVALAMRLADKLKSELAATPTGSVQPRADALSGSG